MPELPLSPTSHLEDVFQAGDFAVTAEVGPPRGANPEVVRRKARLVRGWVDAVNVTDGQSAVVRMASWAGSMLALEVGVEPVMQLQCRDRNRIALQADLLGAAAVGIRNVLLLTGDHMRFGDHPDAKGVFDLDSVQLIWMAATLRDRETLLSGRRLSSAPRWLIGAVENPFAPPLRFRAARLAKKVAAGAQFVQTQYIFDVGGFAAWMSQVRDLGLPERCKVLAGVGPIKSLRALDVMSHEVPGLVVPEDVTRRLRGVPPERVVDEGIKLCAETIEQVRAIDGVSGVHVMAFGHEEAIPEVLERAGCAPGQRSRQPSGEVGARAGDERPARAMAVDAARDEA
jgi:methylenetetrahydrofolate reductase (NADPH)